MEENKTNIKSKEELLEERRKIEEETKELVIKKTILIKRIEKLKISKDQYISTPEIENEVKKLEIEDDEIMNKREKYNNELSKNNLSEEEINALNLTPLVRDDLGMQQDIYLDEDFDIDEELNKKYSLNYNKKREEVEKNISDGIKKAEESINQKLSNLQEDVGGTEEVTEEKNKTEEKKEKKKKRGIFFKAFLGISSAAAIIAGIFSTTKKLPEPINNDKEKYSYGDDKDKDINNKEIIDLEANQSVKTNLDELLEEYENDQDTLEVAGYEADPEYTTQNEAAEVGEEAQDSTQAEEIHKNAVQVKDDVNDDNAQNNIVVVEDSTKSDNDNSVKKEVEFESTGNATLDKYIEATTTNTPTKKVVVAKDYVESVTKKAETEKKEVSQNTENKTETVVENKTQDQKEVEKMEKEGKVVKKEAEMINPYASAEDYQEGISTASDYFKQGLATQTNSVEEQAKNSINSKSDSTTIKVQQEKTK